ncbi:MAG: DUF3837 family protein [Lachnospiraceae bacterium]|nr:DUF3837 family protein [Lachnospiraceae bacterium]
MVESIVRDAVEIKLGFENFTGILQSDYELAYALGKAVTILQMDVAEPVTSKEIEDIWSRVVKAMEGYQPANSQEENLFRLIKIYRIQKQKEEDAISNLFHSGRSV